MGSINRRSFLKIVSLSIYGMFAGGVFEAVRADDFKRDSNLLVNKKLKTKRWAMAVDLTTINENIIKNCIKKCHSMHNVPNIKDKRHEIKWIWAENFEAVFPDIDYLHLRKLQNKISSKIPVLCNHCDNPPCVRVCPTKATFRRDDGIVTVDMHRCIGCKFCIVACPYGARSFNFTDPRKYIEKLNYKYPTREEGVVEKCDFCIERVDLGLSPECVKVSEGSLIFGDIYNPQSEISNVLGMRDSIRRKITLGTKPQIYYLL